MFFLRKDTNYNMQKRIYFILAIYFILGTLIFKYFQYYTVTDIVPYLDIAKKYLNGDFLNAINGIWGVLISWLLVPFLWLGIKPIVSFKILNLLVGGISIVGFDKLSKKFGLSEKTNGLLLLIAIPAVLSFALVHTTPDLLSTCILIFYLNGIFDDDYGKNIWQGVLVGFLGGLGYLAKHYVFPFIIIHLFLSHAFHYFSNVEKEKKKKIIINLIISYTVFLIISVSWISILSNKYGYFTFGTSMGYNRAWMSPASRGQSPEYFGLVPPSNSTANSMWEDLTYSTKLMPGNNWSPFSSLINFRYQIKLVYLNLVETFLTFNKFALFIGPLLFLYCFLYSVKHLKDKNILKDKIFLSLVVLILYSSGYLLIRASDRYIWITYFLTLLIGGICLEKFEANIVKMKMHKIITFIIILLFSLSFIFTPIRRFLININQDKNIYDLSISLRGSDVKGRIASNINWSNTSILSYYLDTKYFGMPIKDNTTKDIDQQLKDSEIDYYLEWNDVNNFNFGNKYPFLKLDDLVIYKLK